MLPSHPSDVRRVAASELGELVRPRRYFVSVAHPDDDCFGCSGTAAKWAAASTDVDMAVATEGFARPQRSP